MNDLAGGVPVVAPGTAAVVARIGAFILAAPGVSGNVNISQNAPIYLPSTIALATFGIFSSPRIYRRKSYSCKLASNFPDIGLTRFNQ